MTEQPSDLCYPQIFLIPFIKGKSGVAYGSDVAFLQKVFSSASSGPFCPLRFVYMFCSIYIDLGYISGRDILVDNRTYVLYNGVKRKWAVDSICVQTY